MPRFILAPGLWLAAWSLLPSAFGVWLTLLVVYAAALAGFGLYEAIASSSHRTPDRWRSRFVRVGGMVVASGLVAIGYALLALLSLVLRGHDPFPR